jgi:hypothetical protein
MADGPATQRKAIRRALVSVYEKNRLLELGQVRQQRPYKMQESQLLKSAATQVFRKLWVDV